VNPASSSSVTQAGRNASVTSLLVCCGFVVCWSFNVIYFGASLTRGTAPDLSWWFYHFSMIMVFVSSCINPFIYAAKYREFQTAVKRLLSKQVQPAQSEDAAVS